MLVLLADRGPYPLGMAGHEVMPFVNGVSAKLAARSRHVCAFLGAGAARACGLPDVAGLQSQVLEGLEGDQRAVFDTQLAGRNLEQALSRLRRIAVLLDGTGDKVDGLTAEQARTLDPEVCRLIVAALDLANADVAPMLRLAAWVARADYHLPVELFTVNYDLLLESALEDQRRGDQARDDRSLTTSPVTTSTTSPSLMLQSRTVAVSPSTDTTSAWCSETEFSGSRSARPASRLVCAALNTDSYASPVAWRRSAGCVSSGGSLACRIASQ